MLVVALLSTACAPASAPAAKPTEAPKAAPAATTAPAPKPTEAAAKPAEKPADGAAKPTAAKPVATEAAKSAAAAKPGEQPQRGGELSFVVSAEPPSFDGHRETTFAMLHPTAPHYSLLIKFNPEKYPEVMPDLAESWEISQDRLTYTFKIRDGVKFHDGTSLTSRDVKASYDRIINPPEGVISARKAQYTALEIESVTDPDPRTVVFKLRYPSAAMLTLLASPWNYIYSADKLAADPRWYEKNIMGTGPFTFVEYVPGSHWVGKRNDNYFLQGLPYLDGFRATFIRETAAQVAAVRGGRAQVEFRGFTPPARDDLVRALGDQIVVQEAPWITSLIVVINTEKKPFDDPRVRRALNLALDRWEGSNALSKITFVKPVGALMRPGSGFDRPESELLKLPGFGRDGNAAKDEAKRLLREAGVSDGFSFTLKNRDVANPYEPTGVFLIDQWRKIGLNVQHVQQETAAYENDKRSGNFEVSVDFLADYLDEPDVQLSKFISADRSPSNYGKYTDRELDRIFEQQSRETDPEKRKQLVWQFEDRVVGEMAYTFPIIWWQRIIPHAAALKGYEVLPTHYVNQDLTDVWLAQ
jgi:peptide/nickel transport system substrate-binding protein